MIDQRTTTSGHVLICVAAIYRAGRCRFPPQSIPPKCSPIHSAIALDVDDVVRANGSCNEADARTRTGDPFITSEVLYQLSYVGGAGIVAPGLKPRSIASTMPLYALNLFDL